jgi:RNA polymerase sigma factor (sigma-70 family)
MKEKPDAQLLRVFVEGRNQDVFRELVRRYTNLVYSAAYRHTGRPELAEDLAQEVFTDLARKAGTLLRAPGREGETWSLAGWLYRSTRLAALEHLRKERRREARERQVMANPELAEGEVRWEAIQPLIDDALSELADDDREALLLRFFKERDFRSIGTALGVSEDTAQKRVTRALEKLRAILARQGVTASAMVLTTTLSANAVMLAPSGLPALLASTALANAALNWGATATAIKAAAATTLQKLAVGGSLSLLVGAGLFQAGRAVSLGAQAKNLSAQNAVLQADIRQFQQERDQAADQANSMAADLAVARSPNDELLLLRKELTGLDRESQALRDANARLARAAGDLDKTPEELVAERVARLKQWIKDHPDQEIPEFKYLAERDWESASAVSPDDMRLCAQRLRYQAQHTVTLSFLVACNQYLRQKSGEMPFDLSELKPFLRDTPDDRVLQRYAVLPASALVTNLAGGDWIVTALDWFGDSEGGVYYASKNAGTGGSLNPDGRVLMKIYQDYSEANHGRMPHQPSDLLPYLTTPERRAAYDKLMPR